MFEFSQVAGVRLPEEKESLGDLPLWTSDMIWKFTLARLPLCERIKKVYEQNYHDLGQSTEL